MSANPRSRFHASFWNTSTRSLQQLDSEESKTFGEPIHALNRPLEKPQFATAFDAFLEDSGSIPEITWTFLAHCHILPLLSVQDRAQQHEKNHPVLQKMLLDYLLPLAFITLENFLSQWDKEVDVDGNIFCALLRSLLSQPQASPEAVVGSEVFSTLRSVYPSPPSFSSFASRFPPPKSETIPLEKPPTLHLLQFENEIFDDHMLSIRMSVDQSASEVPFGKMEFGKDTIFEDRRHWHNPKRFILPKYLGGEDQKKLKDVVHRRKLLRRNQQFITRLGRDAATLTGALGAHFYRITIPLVGMRKRAPAHPRIASTLFELKQ